MGICNYAFNPMRLLGAMDLLGFLDLAIVGDYRNLSPLQFMDYETLNQSV